MHTSSYKDAVNQNMVKHTCHQSMKSLFDLETEQVSEEFKALRDDPHNAQMKKTAQDMWQLFAAWADPDFPRQFALNVHLRFWEMYLGVRLLERNLQLIPKQSSFGPDFHIQLGGAHLWVEATTAEEGMGDDAVPSIFEHRGYEPIPEDKIILRFTNAIAEKTKKREDYIKKGVINPSDAFVIALNGRGIGMTLFEGPLPAIIKSVYPAGDYSLTIDINTHEIVQEGYQIRFLIHKRSGAPVSTKAFLDRCYSGVSGVLYSNAALWDMPTTPGCEFLYVDNSVADTHLKFDWFGMGKYCYYKEENQLTIVTQPLCT